MDEAYHVPDSTDWLNTPLHHLAAVENSLHCQICKEFYDTPMITTCNHTFCSKCIRTSLSADGKCPACRAADQANKLRNNWALQEVVSSFLAARPATLEVARKAQQDTKTQASPRPGKRKRNIVLDLDDTAGAGAGSPSRTTRRKSRRIAASQESQPEAIEIDTSEDEEEQPRTEPAPNDGLVECPLGCGKRMKEEQVFGHLDNCDDEQKQANRARPRDPVNSLASARHISEQITRPQDRINELNYSMMKESALSKKLKDIGIPNFGSKPLMINRHKEWVNIWNANCDSNQPRSRRDLIRDLDAWERTQGGKAPSANGISSTIMRKDFDGDAYSRRHRDEFSRLIADARRKKNIPVSASSPLKDVEILDSDTDAGEETDKSHLLISTSSADVAASQKNDEVCPKSQTIGDADSCENNPEAISAIQRKVDAVNRGEEFRPILNEDSKIPGTEFVTVASTAHAIPDAGSSPVPGIITESNGANWSMGNATITPVASSQPNQQSITNAMSAEVGSCERVQSLDEHIEHDKTGSPRDLTSHLDSGTPDHAKGIPMFDVPNPQISEIDGAVAGS